MRNPLFSRLPSSNRPRDKLVTYYLWCFDKRIPEMRQAQEAKELQEINDTIRPFDIQKLPHGSYCLALRFSFFDGEYAGYGQAAFDSYATSKGEAPVDELGLHSHGSGYDWDDVFRYAFKDTPGAQELEFDSEAGCFFCCSNSLELLKTCAATMRSCCENQEQFTALVREALDYGAEHQIVGRVSFANGEKFEYTDPDEYIKAVREELPYHAASGFRYETLTDDSQVRKAVDDILYNLYGEQNPRPLEDYTKPQGPTMQMGGL